MNKLSPPFWVFENNLLYIFESLEKLQSSLEAIDVENDEYVFFDNQGNLLKISVITEKERGWFFTHHFSKIDIEKVEIIANQFDYFSEKIKNYFLDLSKKRLNGVFPVPIHHDTMVAYLLGVEGYHI